MKKVLLLAFASAWFASNAQTIAIPNAGFENWSPSFLGEMPNGWSVVVESFKTSDANTGNYALKIGYTGIADFDTSSNSCYTFVNTTLKPSKLIVYAKFSFHPLDTAAIYIFADQDSDSLETNIASGYGEMYFGGTQATYKKIEIPIVYRNNDPITVIGITILTGQEKSDRANDINFPSSFLYIDDMRFEVALGFDDEQFSPGSMLLFPNPAKEGYVMLQTGAYTIYDVAGHVVLQGMANDPEFKLDISTFRKGIYTLRLQDETGVSRSQKLVIE